MSKTPAQRVLCMTLGGGGVALGATFITFTGLTAAAVIGIKLQEMYVRRLKTKGSEGCEGSEGSEGCEGCDSIYESCCTRVSEDRNVKICKSIVVGLLATGVTLYNVQAVLRRSWKLVKHESNSCRIIRWSRGPFAYHGQLAVWGALFVCLAINQLLVDTQQPPTQPPAYPKSSEDVA